MTDPTVQEIMERRTKGWLPLDEWGPKCNGCLFGDSDEYRIDGYCSIECRDYHSDEDIPKFAAEIERQAKEIERLRMLLRELRALLELMPRPSEHALAVVWGVAMGHADAALNEKEPRDADA